MTVSSELNRKTFAGDAVTTSFGTSPVVFFDTSDLVVFVVDSSGTATTLVENTGYTVTGGAGSTGTVDLSSGSSPHGAVAVGSTLVIVRSLPIVQETDFVQNDSSDAEVAEDALDRVVMILQQLNARIARSFVLADSDVSDADLTVPTPSADKLVGWNAAGDALENKTPADLDLAVVTAFVATLIDDANADTFVQTLVSGLSAEIAPAVDDVVLIGDTSEGKGNKMTTANLWKVINAFTEDLTPDKTADYVASYDVSASAAKKIKLQELPLPRSYLAGGGLANNGSDATNDIDVAAGECRDSTNAVNIRWSALTKQLDASFAAGTNAGGRSAVGAISNGTWHVFAIRKDSDGTGDILFDTSATAPTMPSGYTYFRRVASTVRASAAIKAFSQFGDEFLWSATVQDANALAITSTAQLVTLTIPTGVKMIARFTHGDQDGNFSTLFSSPDQTDEAAITGRASSEGRTTDATNAQANDLSIRTNTSAQVRVRSSANGNVTVYTKGWIDRRGRDD